MPTPRPRTRQADATDFETLPDSRARQHFRRRLLTWVPAARPRFTVASNARSLSHPRVRSNAAADAGRSRAAELRGMAAYTRRSRRLPPRPKKTSRRPGGRLATTSGPAACTRLPGSRWPITAASCRRTRRRFADSKASRVHRGRPAQLCFRTARRYSRHQRRAYRFACSSAAAI